MMEKKVVRVLIFAFLAMILTACGSEGFDKMYSGIANEKWCTITSDGYGMTIDENPDGIDMSAVYSKSVDDFTQSEIDEIKRVGDEANQIESKIISINKDLGFSDALIEKMRSTTLGDGKQSDSNDKFIYIFGFKSKVDNARMKNKTAKEKKKTSGIANELKEYKFLLDQGFS